MDAVTNVPYSGERAGQGVRAGQPGARGAGAEDQGAGRRAGRADHDDRRRAAARRRRARRRRPAAQLPARPGPAARTPPSQDVRSAIEAARQAAPGWQALSFDDRAAIFLKAADLLAGPWRQQINAATVLGQSKSSYQAEIDAACELIDFWRYNVHYARRLLAEQPANAARQLEPAGVPAARGLRAGDHPVQFHLDRGEPADRSGAARQRRGLEAVAYPAAVGALPDAPAGGGRAAARRDQHGDRRRDGRIRGRAAAPGSGRHPLHRLDRHLPAPVADASGRTSLAIAATRGWSARPAARTS